MSEIKESLKKTMLEMVTDEVITKDEIMETIDDLSELAESDLEVELLDYIKTLVENDVIPTDAFVGILDVAETVFGDESEDEMGDEEMEEGRTLYRRAGYVMCTSGPAKGKIRKRGQCGKAIDKGKRRKMIKAWRKSSTKTSHKRSIRQLRRTKKRLGQI